MFIRVQRKPRALVHSFLIGLMVLLWAAASPAQVSLPSGLSPKERTEIFEHVWRLINEKYYDPRLHGVDWRAVRERYRPDVESAQDDSSFYMTLKEMTGELHDAHTRFRSPTERRRADRLQATSLGLGIGEVDGAPTVISVEPDSEAARVGVEPGMKVQSVDGVPFADRVAKQRSELGKSSSDRATLLLTYYYALTGEPDTTVQLGLSGNDGRPLNVTLTRHLVGIAQPLVPKMLPSGYAYIRFGVFNENVAKQFRQALEKVKDAPGLIIDLRGNGGGNFQGVLRIADYFFPDKVTFGHVNGRSGKKPSFILRWLGVPAELEVGHAGGQIFGGPVVILVNDGSGSGAELFSAGMQENGRAAIVGRQTCGCVLGSVSHRVKGGGEVGISEFDIITAKGQRLEGPGVIPDVVVPLTVDDLRSRRDSALRQAVAILTSSGTRTAER